jgi:hypothetical protein
VKWRNKKSLTLKETWVQRIRSRIKSVIKLKISLKSFNSSIRSQQNSSALEEPNQLLKSLQARRAPNWFQRQLVCLKRVRRKERRRVLVLSSDSRRRKDLPSDSLV